MEHNINAGRLLHYVKVLGDTGAKNEYNEPLPPALVFDCRADVLVRSGDESVKYGVAITSEVITVLTWFDSRAKNSMFIEWEDKTYRIKHIKPDSTRKGMIITAQIEVNE